MAIKLHIFNPEHDLALAADRKFYTPPAEVIKLRKNLALLPASYAGNSDFILIPEDLDPSLLSGLPFYDLTLKKNINIITANQLPYYKNIFSGIIPWGWDKTLVNYLSLSGIPDYFLPESNYLENLREISHRRTSISLRIFLAENFNLSLKNIPLEVFSLDQVENFLNINPISFLKAPWSSSGHGIIVSDHITRKGLLEWAHGMLRRQGSLIIETAWNKVFDFASEWYMENSKATFIGYSVFETSSRGKYHGNTKASQDKIKDLIFQNVPTFSSDIIKAQKAALESLIPEYKGPLGIDMLADVNGEINPCVEINLRLTMGYINIDEGIKQLLK